MTSNYDRSKTIISKTTKNYHPRADDPRLLIIWQKTEDEKLLPVYNCTLKVCLPQRLVSNFTEKDLSVLLMFLYCSKLCKFCLADSFGRTTFEHNHTTGAYN